MLSNTPTPVKLIFEYHEADERKNGTSIGAEQMRVKITDYGDGCLIGRLDSSPQFTKLLKADAAVAFHPKHIVEGRGVYHRARWLADASAAGDDVGVCMRDGA